MGSIPGIGLDYNFVAHSMKLPVNKVSNPVKGEKGYYLIKVLSRTPFNAKEFAIQKRITSLNKRNKLSLVNGLPV